MEKQKLIIQGPAGALEAVLHTPESPDYARFAIVCHPDPLQLLGFLDSAGILIQNVNNSHLAFKAGLVMIISLSDLKLGTIAKVVSLEIASAACRQKMFACGLIPGAEVSVVKLAPLGDPMQIKLDGDVLLSIRKSEGRDVRVEPIA